MIKEKYCEAELEVVSFENVDVITGSCNGIDDDVTHGEEE